VKVDLSARTLSPTSTSPASFEFELELIQHTGRAHARRLALRTTGLLEAEAERARTLRSHVRAGCERLRTSRSLNQERRSRARPRASDRFANPSSEFAVYERKHRTAEAAAYRSRSIGARAACAFDELTKRRCRDVVVVPEADMAFEEDVAGGL
jgi:hypothetical protein